MTQPSEECSQEPIEFADSRTFYGSWCVLTGSLAALSTVSWGWGPFGLIAFGAHAGWALFRLLRRRTRLRVTEDGIVDENFWYSPGLIRWEEIVDVQPTRWGLIDVKLLDEEGFWDRQSALAQVVRMKYLFFGFGAAAIVPWGLTGSRRSIVRAIHERFDAAAIAAMRRERALNPGESGCAEVDD